MISTFNLFDLSINFFLIYCLLTIILFLTLSFHFYSKTDFNLTTPDIYSVFLSCSSIHFRLSLLLNSLWIWFALITSFTLSLFSFNFLLYFKSSFLQIRISEMFVRMFSSFQTKRNLYIAMEYVQGGDCMAMLTVMVK